MPALTAVDNWYECGINKYTKLNVLLQDNRKSNFDDSIGAALFNNIFGINEMKHIYKDYKYVCYKDLVIGTGQQENMYGGLHLKQRLLKFMRNQILWHYNLDPFWKPKTNEDINMLILIKNTSSWHHENWPINLWTEVPDWINQDYVNTKKINKLYVMNPSLSSFADMIVILNKVSIILCQWGGISLSNFLSPLNSVEIIITMFDKKNHYTKQKGWFDKIPDFDMAERDAISTQITLRYWDKTDNSRIFEIEKNKLYHLIDASLQIIHSNYHIKPNHNN